MRPRFLTTIIIGLGFIAVAIIGLVFFVQFRGLTREYSTFTRESYTTYIDLLNKNTLANMTNYIEQEYPILHDTERLKREAGTDWFWDTSGELTRIAKTFGLAYIYYIDKTDSGYVFLMSSGISRDEHPEWLGGPVWRGPAPSYVDEAWASGKLTFTPEPTVDEWGILISAVLPILTDGRVVGILGADYEVSHLMQTLRQNEDELAGHGKTLVDRLLIALIVSLVVIMSIMGVQITVDRTVIVIPAQVMEANEHTQIMMNAMPMACSVWGENGVMLDCNLEALKMLGLSEKSDYIDHFFDLCPERQSDGTSTREKTATLIKAAFDTGYQRFEWMYLTAQGQELPVETTLVRVAWEGGYQLAAYSRDLREIKAKEEAARESEARIKLMLDTMSLGCCFFNPEGYVIDCNQRAIVMFGCKDKQGFIAEFHSLSPECQSDGLNSRERAHEEIRKAFSDGKNGFYWEHQKLDGTPLPVEVTLYRVQWKNDHRVVAYMRDLSALRESEDSLKRILSLTEGSPSLMLYIGAEGAIEYMNPALSTVTLFSNAELLRGGLQLMFSPEDFQHIEQEYVPAALQNRIVNFEMQVIDKNGGRRDFSFSAFAAELRDGRTGIGLLGRDITELKLMQRNLMVAMEQAKAALAYEVQLNKMKSDFLSRVSHELRTPLNAIIGMTAIAEKSSGGKDQEHCFEKIKEASEQLLGMVNDILDMTDIDAGMFDFVPQPFSFAAAMRTVIGAITPKANIKGQTFITNIDGNIHDSLVSDERRLTQVLVKLLTNAVKFTPEKGTVSLSARLLENRDDECLVRFEVGDNGIGIHKEVQQRLWGIFEQADNSITRKFDGMGIGLPLSKRIVALLNGEIRVDSEPGEGSRFICDIRLGIDRSAADPQSLDAGVGASGDFTGRRFLIVDDIEINREILFAILEGTGALLDEAQDGEEAVRMFSQNKYDLVLMDLHMPVMDGFTATQEIRALALPRSKMAPVISVSAESSVELHSKCLEAGITDHLPKPIDANALFTMIAKWLPR